MSKRWTPERAREYHQEYSRNWYKAHRGERLAQIHKYKREHKEQLEEARRKLRQRQREQIKALLGHSCFFCGFEPDNGMLRSHEIHGSHHTNSYNYIIKHHEDFVALCNHCHTGVHFCMKYLGLSWDQILSLKKVLVHFGGSNVVSLNFRPSPIASSVLLRTIFPSRISP